MAFLILTSWSGSGLKAAVTAFSLSAMTPSSASPSVFCRRFFLLEIQLKEGHSKDFFATAADQPDYRSFRILHLVLLIWSRDFSPLNSLPIVPTIIPTLSHRANKTVKVKCQVFSYFQAWRASFSGPCSSNQYNLFCARVCRLISACYRP